MSSQRAEYDDLGTLFEEYAGADLGSQREARRHLANHFPNDNARAVGRALLTTLNLATDANNRADEFDRTRRAPPIGARRIGQLS